MGKLDNIKRAKRLKEIKRKREQDVLIKSGQGPSSIAIRKRAELNGGATVLNQDKIKYSELLESFVHPIVKEEDPIDIVRTKYTFGAHAWNAAIMKEKNEELYLLAKKDLASIIPNVPEIELLFEEMIKRKQEEFADYKNIIADFEIKKLRGHDYDLTVATTQLKDF